MPQFPDISAIVKSAERLAALRRTALMDSPTEEAFDRPTRLVARILGAHVAICTLFDDQRHFFKSTFGLPEGTAREHLLDLTFCQYVAASRELLVLEDTAKHPLYRDHPRVVAYNIRAYLGVPLITSQGYILGTFCVIHHESRTWSAENIRSARDLAAAVMTEIELRTLVRESQALAVQAQAARDQAEALALRNSELYRQAQEAGRLRERFVSVATHDLRNPLQSISLTSQQLARLTSRCGEAESQVLQRGLACLDKAAHRMNALVDELLDMARLQAGQPVELTLRPTELVSLVHTVAREAEAVMRTHALQVTTSAPTLRARCDTFRIERVLTNLLTNAVKYSPGGSLISIRVRQEQGAMTRWGVIEVEDPGLGIPAEDVPHLFSWFRRGGNVVGRIEGTGIGLASSRLIVEQHGGTLSVVSLEGQGSTFTLRLPLEEGSTPARLPPFYAVDTCPTE